MSSEGASRVLLRPVTANYLAAASSTDRIYGRLPAKAGEAVLAYEEALALFGGEPGTWLGREFAIEMKAPDEVLSLFPEGTFAELENAPDCYRFTVVGAVHADYASYLASRNRSPVPVRPRHADYPALILSADLCEPAILGSSARWPDAMLDAMRHLPIAASAWMRADSEHSPALVERLR